MKTLFTFILIQSIFKVASREKPVYGGFNLVRRYNNRVVQPQNMVRGLRFRNYSILSLAFIASSFRVTEENLVFETVQSGPYSSFEFFSALKGTHFYILLDRRAI